MRTDLLQMLRHSVRQDAIERNPAESAQTIRVKKNAELALRPRGYPAGTCAAPARREGTDKQGRRRYTQIGDVADMYIATDGRTKRILALDFSDIVFDVPIPFVRIDKTLIVSEDGKLDVRMNPKTDDSIRDAKLPP